MKQIQWLKRHEKLLPWVAGAGFAVSGAGFAVSHLVIASSCTVPKEGRCSTCGGCVVALAAIVTWAIYKKREGNEFYENNTQDQGVLNNHSDSSVVPKNFRKSEGRGVWSSKMNDE